MKLLAIDGNSILNRAFYGIRPLSNTQGIFTHAIFGFMNIFLKIGTRYSPMQLQWRSTCASPRSGTRRWRPIRQTERECRRSLPCSCPI